MYDTETCRACTSAARMKDPCSYCGEREEQAVLHRQAKEFKKMHKEALAETLKVESYEGQFSELHRKTQNKASKIFSEFTHKHLMNEKPFAFGRINPVAFASDTEKDNYIEELFARNKRQEKTIKDLNKGIASQDSKLSTELWEVKGALASSKKTNKWLSENNENLKAENRRHKSSIFHNNKRHEDLMNYQDKQNEEIGKLNRDVKQLKKIQTDYVETVIRIENLRIDEEFENTKLKERNKTQRKKARQLFEQNKSLKALRKIELNKIDELYAQIDGERTCFGCKADITATGGLPIVCQKCDCKDNWEAK